jgi:transposase-like protein
MARRGAPRDRGKERFWRRLLQLWQRSGRTIRAFCAEHGVSEPSFFAWRRTIAERDQRHTALPDFRTGDCHDAQHTATTRQPTFVPLRIVPAPTGELPRAFEVVLHGDRVVRVPAGFDAASLRQLLAILEEERPC